MPYTGLPNRDVMQLVTGGGRLGIHKRVIYFYFTKLIKIFF
jgi:hypothetical protein